MRTHPIRKDAESDARRISSPVRRRALRRQAIHRACLEVLEARRLLSFSPAVSYPAGAGPQDVASADFNGDGRLDLATANSNADTVSVLLGNANGTFQAAQSSATGPGPQSIAVGDFNADGKLDVATSNTNTVTVLLGNGNGTFQPPSALDLGVINTGSTPAGVAVGDFNADGKLDLAAATNVYYPGGGGWYSWYPGWYVGRVNVLLGNGTGGFTTSGSIALGDYNPLASLSLADFNGDSKLDAATVSTAWDYSWSSPYTVVAFGNGTGGFSSSVIASYTSAPTSVKAGDVNADGKPDLVTANSSGSVSVALGNGAGAFGAAEIYATGARPSSIAMADFNSDSRIDLITSNADGGSVTVLLGRGAGTFTPPIAFAVGPQPGGVAAGDFNNDGRADAASANAGSNDLSVLLNDGTWPSANSPLITITDTTVTEGNVGTTPVSLTVKLSAPWTQSITVNVATADGSATVAGGDYIGGSGMLTFAPGEVSKTITGGVKGDRIAEPTEYFSVLLSNATNAFIADSAGTVTILDNEPRITIDNYAATEGNSGTKAFSFVVHLSTASDAPVSVNYSTVEGDIDAWPINPYSYYYGLDPATAGTDFVDSPGTLTFAAGETSKAIVVTVNGDRAGENDEAFTVVLSNPTGSEIVDDHALGVILNDEPSVSAIGGSVVEGHSGTKLLPYTVTLSNATDVPVTVNYATSDGTATTAGGDYVANAGSVTFAPGETSKTINVTVNGDRRGEAYETVNLNLTGATNAGISTTFPVSGYIIDDEPRISVNHVSLVEGNSGTKLMTFTVSLSAAYDQTVSVNYATADSSATAGTDYVATSGTLTFAAGVTTKTFTVSIKGDKQKEWDEAFSVVLSNASTNALIEDPYGSGTILDDDRRR